MWSIKTFSELTTTELYAIYELRVKTFVVEQQRIYQEVDDTDLKAYHVFKTSIKILLHTHESLQKMTISPSAGSWWTKTNADNTWALI